MAGPIVGTADDLAVCRMHGGRAFFPRTYRHGEVGARLKLLGLDITRTRNAVNGKSPSTSELGSSGVQIFSGMLGQQDYNATLQTPSGYDEYDKMRLSDGQVKAALTIIKLPLLNADWHVESASDSADDKDIADYLQNGLMDGMSHTFAHFLRQSLLMLDYGSIPFEKVWRIEDGKVTLQKLAPRLPRTITQWMCDDQGGLKAIRQSGAFSTNFREVDIPIDKLIVFVNDQEGGNWRGTSILRAAWKHWYFKQGLERIQSIALEKRSLGVDVAKLQGEAITDQRKQEAERALMTLHSHEKQFFVEVEGQVAYRLEGMGTAGVLDPAGAIEYHDLRIVRSMIVEFLAMGAGSTGSLAMHKDKSSLFLLSLGGIANNIAETINRHLIHQWVDYNWTVKDYPRIRYSRLEARDVEVYAKAVSDLVGAEALHVTPDVEEEARSLLNLPPSTLDLTVPETVPPDIANIPTNDVVTAVRTLRAVLKQRREAEKEPVNA